MSTTAARTVLTGTPVVPGVVLGPVVRPSGAVLLPAEAFDPLPETAREEERARFTAAAEAVAGRLAERAAPSNPRSSSGSPPASPPPWRPCRPRSSSSTSSPRWAA